MKRFNNLAKKKLITKTFAGIVFSMFSVLLINACKHEKMDVVDSDLLEKSKTTSGFIWYKNSDSYLDKSSGTGHNYKFLKTRYNNIAARKLGSDGKIIAGAKFEEGSLVVKELFKEKGEVDRFAILYKDSKNQFADTQGWVWGYIDGDGKVAAPASEKGKSCNSCHSQADNIDYMLMNKFFP